MESSAGERRWTGYVIPAVVALLLGVQFFLGFRGFDQPDGGLLGLLEAPGALLGWGGVVILAVLLGWLIAGLVGRDLFGLQGASGLVVRLVGCVALGLALSGLVGLLGGRAAGGEVGAGIGGLLGDSLGTVPAVLILVLMAIPALVLSISPFFTTGPKVRRPGAPVSMDALSDLEPKPGLYEGSTTHQTRPLYPERRFDEEGHEIPMSFGARDVGQVRYADEEPDPAERDRSRKPDPVPVPDAALLPAGVRFADDDPDEGADGPLKPDPVDADDGRIPLADGVRYVDEPEPEPESDEDLADEGAEGEGEAESTAAADGPERGSQDRVERAAEPPPTPPPPPPPRPPSVPAVAPTPVSGPPPPEVKGADALGQLRDEDEGARYRAKLEGSGIFDEPAAPVAGPEPVEEPEAKEQAAASRKKKPTARKQAAARKKKKPAPKKKAAAKKAAPRKKVPAKKKATAASMKKADASPSRKATAKKKKPAPRKRPAPDPEPEEVTPIEEAGRRKGAGVTGPEDEIYRRAVAVAMERSAASSVLLSRRLGIGYAQARALIELLVKDGVLGEMTPSGSRPLLLTAEEWARRTG